MDGSTWHTNACMGRYKSGCCEGMQDISAEYASGVSGTVRAVLGQSLRPGNVWETAELPALMKNPSVDKIITIDPVTKGEKIIYVRGDQ